MKFTKFENLKNETIKLGATPTFIQLDKVLTGHGIPVTALSKEIVIGNSGIYHIDREGLLTKVVIHIVDKNLSSQYSLKIRPYVISGKFDSSELIKGLNKYHLVNCGTIERADREGWRKDRYRISRRTDGKFYYRYIENNEVFKEKDDQKLSVCKNCLKIINEISGNNFSVSGFKLDKFLSSNFEIPQKLDKQGQYEDMCAPNIYKSDWSEISRKYRELVQYKCENTNCPNNDLSDPEFHNFLHTHHVSQEKSNNNYSNLKAYCIYCHAQQPNHSQLLNTPDYNRYVSLRNLQHSL